MSFRYSRETSAWKFRARRLQSRRPTQSGSSHACPQVRAPRKTLAFSKDVIEKMKWNNEIWHQFRNFLPFSALFGHYLWESRDISSFSENIREILTKFHQHFAEKWPNSSTKIGMKWNFISFRPKSLTVFCWNFEVLAVRRQRNHVELEKSWKMRLFSLS